MTDEEERFIRRSVLGHLHAVNWLKNTRSWSFAEAKEYYDAYRKEHGLMRYDHIFKDMTLPEETVDEVLGLYYEEVGALTEKNLDSGFIFNPKSKYMKQDDFEGPEIAPIPDIPEELLEPVGALLNTARMYQGMIAEAIKGTTSIEKSMFTNRIDIADNVMASWNHKLPPE